MIERKSFAADLDWQQLKKGAFRQRSAIWALIFKEFRIQMGKSRIGLFWVLFQPVISMLMLSMIRYVSGHSSIEGIHIMLFVGAGFTVFNIFRLGLTTIPHAINANMSLLNYPQVKPIDTVLARLIQGVWLQILASLFMYSGLWWILGIHPDFPDPLLSLQALAVAILLALGVAFPITVFGTINESVMKVVAILGQPLLFLSAILYSMSELPPTARKVLAWNPVVHIISAFRQGAFGVKPFAEYNFFYPTMLAVFLVGFGYALFYLYRFRLLLK